MSELERITSEVVSSIRSRLTWITEIRSISRQHFSGEVFEKVNMEYSGLRDGACSGYIRHRDKIDRLYSAPSQRITSKPEALVKAPLRLVLMMGCSNIEELAEATVSALMLASGNGVSVIPVSDTCDSEAIFRQETKKEGYRGSPVLFMVDFDVNYRIASSDSDCEISCDEC